MVMRYECCIGNFDGVHKGHQKLIAATVRQAREHGMIPAAITFDPHPMSYLSGKPFPLLTTLAQKKELLYRYGIEEVIIFPFDEILASMADSDFIRFVLNEMEIHKLICGSDFHYGNRGKGNTEKLLNDDNRKFDVEIIDDLMIEERKLSSSMIRELIENGRIEKAVELLGHSYEIESGENVLPPSGRYLIEADGQQKEYRFNPNGRIRKISFLKEL